MEPPAPATSSVHAFVPFANMFGYGADLKRISEGRAHYAMRYDHYAPLPAREDDPSGTFPPAMGMRVA